MNREYGTNNIYQSLPMQAALRLYMPHSDKRIARIHPNHRQGTYGAAAPQTWQINKLSTTRRK
ncbi:MAG: hypothetical protein V8T45_01255 [Oscillospiraceae bacterium]